MKKQSPMLMSTPMVQATLEGRKTMTRRLTGLKKLNEDPGNFQFIRFQDYKKDGSFRAVFERLDDGEIGSVKSPYGRPGDLIWIRESGWCDNNHIPGLNDAEVYFKA